jgi:hypothetical protein
MNHVVKENIPLMRNIVVIFHSLKMHPSALSRHRFNIYLFYLLTIILVILLA